MGRREREGGGDIKEGKRPEGGGREGERGSGAWRRRKEPEVEVRERGRRRSAMEERPGPTVVVAVTEKGEKRNGEEGEGGGVDVGERGEGSGGGRREGRRLFLAEEEPKREKEESGEQQRPNKGRGDLRLQWLSAVAMDDDGGDEVWRWCSARWRREEEEERAQERWREIDGEHERRERARAEVIDDEERGDPAAKDEEAMDGKATAATKETVGDGNRRKGGRRGRQEAWW